MAVDNSNLQLVENEINKLHAAAESSISELNAAASAQASWALKQAGFDNNPTWNIANGREVVMAGLGDLPTDRPKLTVPPFTFNPEDLISADMLKRHNYDSDFYDTFLDAKLRDFINAKSYFIEQSVQDAMFNQTRERDLQVLTDEVDMIERKESRRGFNMPFSMMQAAKDVAIERHGDKRTDTNHKITSIIAERGHQGVMHAIDAGNQMEQVRSKFQLEFGRLYWQAADYLIAKYEADVRAEATRVSSEFDMIKLKTLTDSSMADKDHAYTQLKHDQEVNRFQGTVDEMKINFETWKQETQMRIDATVTAIDYYRNSVASTNSILNDVAFKDFE